MLSPEAQKRIDGLLWEFQVGADHQAGYPVNQDFDYAQLYPLLEYCANNVGDPFRSSHYQINTHLFEREVVHRAARLFQIEPDDAWGYVANGGTEGNLQGLYLARELHHDAVAYFSQDTHYSVAKNLHLLNIPNIMVRSQDDGQIDYDDLRESIRVNRHRPAIVVANIGTTMKGAIDDLPTIRAIFDELAITRTYIHADAALHGLILPFVDDPQPFTFADGIDSISVSGHKVIGSPLPCGIFVGKRQYAERIGREIEYVGAHDTTLSGSRNAWTPLLIWYAFERHGEDGFRRIVQRMLETAEYGVQQFRQAGLNAWRHRNSPVVVIDRPSPDVLFHWQLARLDDFAHFIAMPHVDRDLIDRILHDCLHSPFRDQAADQTAKPPATPAQPETTT